MIFNVSSGHNPDGMIASGAVGLLQESTEVRKIKDRVIALLNANGHTAYDSTCDNGTSVLDVLKQICMKSNSRKVDFDVSIHLNSFKKDYAGDGNQMGTEVLILNNTSSELNAKAKEVCDSICALGFKNRGVKLRPDLYFLGNTKALALLVECFFLDDKDDVDVYDVEKMAQAIVKGLVGVNVTPDVKPPVQEENKPAGGYQGGSITDYLKSIGVDSSFANRESLAKQHGMTGYIGTATQNTMLLELMRSGSKPSSSVKWLNLNADVIYRSVYDTSMKNVVLKVKPSQFGGLSYRIEKYINSRYVQITTNGGVTGAVCIDTKVDSRFSITDKRIYQNGNN